MGDEQKEVVRIASPSGSIPGCGKHYKGLETRFIIHDAGWRAEVDRDTFFHTRESGGTMSSRPPNQALQGDHRRRLRALGVEHLPLPLLRRRHWERGRYAPCASDLLKTAFCAVVNLFCYGHGGKPLRSGAKFIKDLRETSAGPPFRERARFSETRDRGHLRQASRTFLGKGK